MIQEQHDNVPSHPVSAATQWFCSQDLAQHSSCVRPTVPQSITKQKQTHFSSHTHKQPKFTLHQQPVYMYNSITVSNAQTVLLPELFFSWPVISTQEFLPLLTGKHRKTDLQKLGFRNATFVPSSYHQ